MSTKKNPLGLRHALPPAIVIAGLVLSLRHVSADAPAGRFNVGSDTVYDTQTKLTWQRMPAPSSSTWIPAASYCKGLKLGPPGTVWRLPTVPELQTIVDDSQDTPAIDRTAFPGVVTDAFWTSMPYLPDAGGAWAVRFSNGNAEGVDETTDGSVRCVY